MVSVRLCHKCTATNPRLDKHMRAAGETQKENVSHTKEEKSEEKLKVEKLD